jgi:hypothetical protein
LGFSSESRIKVPKRQSSERVTLALFSQICHRRQLQIRWKEAYRTLAAAGAEKCRLIPAPECSEMAMTRRKATITITKTPSTKARQVLLAELFSLLIY